MLPLGWREDVMRVDDDVVIISIVGVTIAFLWLYSKVRQSIRDEYEHRLQKWIDDENAKLDKEFAKRTQELEAKKADFEAYKNNELGVIGKLKQSFSSDVLSGRRWAASYLSAFYSLRDDLIVKYLETKKRPAMSAAEEIKKFREERRRLFTENKLLRDKVALYQDYFPFLADLDEEIMCNPSDEFDDAEDIDRTFDRARKYLTAEEYQKLSTTDKNQLALDRYLNGNLSKVQIGRLYEMYLGWLYEKNGYIVTYNGIEQGVEDMGRDLICIKPNETVIVQAKCWSQSKTIHEKHVYQLYGTVCTYKIEHPEVKKVRAFLYVTNQLSPVARAAAQILKIKVEENFALDKSFPMIKCNIGRSGEKIYHLPFDQQYNKTQIKSPGEMYCRTVAEAEANGFRRAKRYFSNPRASHVTP